MRRVRSLGEALASGIERPVVDRERSGLKGRVWRQGIGAADDSGLVNDGHALDEAL